VCKGVSVVGKMGVSTGVRVRDFVNEGLNNRRKHVVNEERKQQ
jgi:hypothetical protein